MKHEGTSVSEHGAWGKRPLSQKSACLKDTFSLFFWIVMSEAVTATSSTSGGGPRGKGMLRTERRRMGPPGPLVAIEATSRRHLTLGSLGVYGSWRQDVLLLEATGHLTDRGAYPRDSYSGICASDNLGMMLDWTALPVGSNTWPWTALTASLL